MKLNYLKIIILFLIALTVFLIVRFSSLNLVLSDNKNIIYNDYYIETRNQEILNKKGNKVSFKFHSDRSNLSKITVSTLRPNYLFEDHDLKLNLSIYYLDKNDNSSEFKYSADFPASKLRNFTTFDFPDLVDSEDKDVIVEFIVLEDAKDDRHKIEIVIGDTDPDPRITTGPRLYYKIKSIDLVGETIEIINNDHKFFSFYFVLILLVLLPVIALFVFDRKKD